jgi:hypothetical protein
MINAVAKGLAEVAEAPEVECIEIVYMICVKEVCEDAC